MLSKRRAMLALGASWSPCIHSPSAGFLAWPPAVDLRARHAVTQKAAALAGSDPNGFRGDAQRSLFLNSRVGRERVFVDYYFFMCLSFYGARIQIFALPNRDLKEFSEGFRFPVGSPSTLAMRMSS